MTELKLQSALDPLSVRQSPSPDKNPQSEKTQEVAEKFEALLLFTMMKSMRTSLTEDTLTGSEQQEMYREMMDQEVANSIAASGGLGIQQMLERQLNNGHSGAAPAADLPLLNASHGIPNASVALPPNVNLMALKQPLKLGSN